MEEIIQLAKKLGTLIARHPRFKALMAARDEVQADGEARKIMQQYHEQVGKIHRLEIEQKPIEPEDKHELERRQQAIASNEKVKKLVRTQVEHAELIRKMNDAIFSEIAAAEKSHKKS